MIQEKKASMYFKSFSDSFTESRGLDQILKDLNAGDENLRNEVLKSISILMKSDDLVCVKLAKLKIMSNIIRYFLVPKEIPESLANNILISFLDCKHKETLLEHSEQFKPEKERL